MNHHERQSKLGQWKKDFGKVRPLGKRSIIHKIIETIALFSDEEKIDSRMIDTIFMTGGGLNLQTKSHNEYDIRMMNSKDKIRQIQQMKIKLNDNVAVDKNTS